jgi:nucleotide-binding universal stress UspA family protein
MVPVTDERLQDLLSIRAEEANKRLRGFAEREMGGFPHESLVLEGDPAEVIVDQTRSLKVDALVIPTQGNGPIRRFLIGSVAAKVLHDVQCPVFTGVHREHDVEFPDFSIRKVLCAVDFGSQTEDVLAWGTKLARDFSAELCAVHATGSRWTEFLNPQTAETSPQHPAERIAALTRDSGIQPSVVVESGEPYKVITGVASRMRADLVIIGQGTSEGAFKGFRANAYAIVRHSPCPVLSV